MNIASCQDLERCLHLPHIPLLGIFFDLKVCEFHYGYTRATCVALFHKNKSTKVNFTAIPKIYIPWKNMLYTVPGSCMSACPGHQPLL